MAKTQIRRYEFHDDDSNSHKFWELHPTSDGFDAFWGRVGSQGQGPKSYTPAEVLKVISQKEKKGYELVD